ncbi:MAG: hypothetical protein AAGA96_09380, partial [Verrucomicrobiota bacterium]
ISSAMEQFQIEMDDQESTINRYPALSLMGLFLCSLGLITGLFLTTSKPSSTNLDYQLLQWSPLLLFLGATLVFELAQWLFLVAGKRLRRAIWYGSYAFGLLGAPLLWFLS